MIPTGAITNSGYYDQTKSKPRTATVRGQDAPQVINFDGSVTGCINSLRLSRQRIFVATGFGDVIR